MGGPTQRMQATAHDELDANAAAAPVSETPASSASARRRGRRAGGSVASRLQASLMLPFGRRRRGARIPPGGPSSAAAGASDAGDGTGASHGSDNYGDDDDDEYNDETRPGASNEEVTGGGGGGSQGELRHRRGRRNRFGARRRSADATGESNLAGKDAAADSTGESHHKDTRFGGDDDEDEDEDTHTGDQDAEKSDADHSENDDDDGEPTVRDIQEAINISHPFGLKIWKPALYPKSRSIDFRSYEAVHSTPGAISSRLLYLSPGNIMWTLVFGWWIAITYIAIAIGIIGPFWLIGAVGYGICWLFGFRSSGARSSRICSYGSPLAWIASMFFELYRLREYITIMFNLAAYMFWPFGKFISRRRGYHMIFQQSDESSAQPTHAAEAGAAAHIDIDVDVATLSVERAGRLVESSGSYYIDESEDATELADLLSEYSLGNARMRRYLWPDWIPNWVRRSWNSGLSGIIFYLVALIVLAPIHLIVSAVCFFCVFPIPMGKLNYVLLLHVLRNPLQLTSNNSGAFQRYTGRPVDVDKILASQTEDVSSSNNSSSTQVQDGSDATLRANTTANAASTNPSASSTPTARPRSRPSRAQLRPASAFVWRPESMVELPGSEQHVTSSSLAPPHADVGHIPATTAAPVINAQTPGSGDAGHKDSSTRGRTQRYFLPTPNAVGSGFGPGISPLVEAEYEVVLCTYHAMGLYYYKYTVDGVNIIFINLLAMIAFTIFDFYIIGPSNGYTGIASHGVIFCCALLSVIPLAYFIGMAVSSITAHTGSVALGSVINATFGSIIEIILYALALMEGKTRLVEGSIIGSFLAGLLALPGVAMLSGGLKRKEQRFNAKSAGVTSTMLVVAVIGAFTPTLFQGIYGSVELRCGNCGPRTSTPASDWSSQGQFSAVAAEAASCQRCLIVKSSPSTDPFYISSTRPLMYVCATVLVLTYAIGLWFTLGTHANKIYPKKKPKKTKHTVRIETPLSPNPRYGSLVSMFSPRSVPVSNSQAPFELKPAEAGGEGSLTSFASPRGQRRGGPVRGDGANGVGDSNSTADAARPISIINLLGLGALQDVTTPTSVASGSQAQPTQSASATLLAPPRVPVHGILSPTHTRNQANHVDSYPSIVGGGTISLEDMSSAGSDSDDGEDEGGHDNPGWGTAKAAIVLLGCTVLYSIIAEVLIDSIDFVLEVFPMDEKILGLTIFALVPTVTEFYNAIAFAMNGNIVLSLEIGSAYVIQVALLQIPALVAFSAFWSQYTSTAMPHATTMASQLPANSPMPLQSVSKAFAAIADPAMRMFYGDPEWTDMPADTSTPSLNRRSGGTDNNGTPHTATNEGFTLVFPYWDFYAVLFSVFLLTYLYIEGKSNYFKGAILLLSYTMFMVAFFYVPSGVDQYDRILMM